LGLSKGVGLAAALALITGLSLQAARADVYWETVTTMTNVRHNRNGSFIQKYYLTPKGYRLDLGGKKIFILDFDPLKLYVLKPKDRKYAVHDLKNLPWFPFGIIAAFIRLRVTPTADLKTIDGYLCHRFKVHFAILNGECWISKEVGASEEFRILGKNMGTVLKDCPLFSQVDIPGAFDQVGGFPVYAVYHVLGGTVSMKLTKVERKTLAPDLFTLPKGYTPGKVKIADAAGKPVRLCSTPWPARTAAFLP
jgi:hypothetical protein